MKLLKLNECTNDAERWAYHTQNYAWRILRGLATIEQKFSPVDRKGKWFDADAIRGKLSEMRSAQAANRTKSLTEMPLSRRDDIAAVEERHRRGHAYRTSKLDEYDAIHHPEALAQRNANRAAAAHPTIPSDNGGGMKPISDILRDLGISAQPQTPKAAE